MDANDRFRLIARNTQEIITEEEILKLLEREEHPTVYLGTAVTGRPHVAYFVWILKLADFLKAGFRVKLLLADLHGALDNTPWDLLEKRYEYYSAVIPAMFDAVGADRSRFEIVRGSDIQLTPKYWQDVLRMATVASMHDCVKAGSEVVKQSENPKVASLIYPIMQALDEEHLGVDIQYGGGDQRKILVFAREQLPKIGYKSRVEVMTPIIPGLVGEKMSASKEESKIDLLDSPEIVSAKLNKAFCPEGTTEGNGVMAFLKHVIMVLKEDAGEEFVIDRPEKFGGPLRYKAYANIEADYVEKKIHPLDLKKAVGAEINALLAPIHERMKDEEKMIRDAYG